MRPDSYHRQRDCTTCRHCVVDHHQDGWTERWCRFGDTEPEPPTSLQVTMSTPFPDLPGGLDVDAVLAHPEYQRYNAALDAGGRRRDEWEEPRTVDAGGICDHYQAAPPAP